MKFLKIFAMLLLFSSPLLAFTDNLWITAHSTSGKIYVINVTSGGVVKTLDLGTLDIIGIDISNESNPILTLLVKSGSNYFLKVYDDDFSPISTIDLGTTTVRDVLRLSSSRYFVLGDSSIREVDSSGSLLDVHSVHAGALMKITQYFVNGSNEFLVMTRRDSASFPAGEVVGNVYNLTSDTQLNITFSSGGSTELECGYLKYNLTDSEMVWSIIDNSGATPNYNYYAHATFDTDTYEILANISNFDLRTWAYQGYDYCWYSEKSDSFMLLNESGELKEVSVTGTRNRDFSKTMDTFIYEVPSNYIITSGFVEDVGVSFDTYEYSAYCGINNPVPDVTCSITDGSDIYSCTTSLFGNGTIVINSTNYPVNYIFKPDNWTVPFTDTLINTSIMGAGGWNITMWYVLGGGIGQGGIPSELNESWYKGRIVFDSPIDVDDIDDMVVWYNSTSAGFICSGGSNFRTEWYVGINSTHYLNRTSFCPSENYTVHDSYIQNTSLIVGGSKVAETPLFTTSNDKIHATVYEVTYWKANNPISDVLIGSLTFVPPQLNVSYNISGRATCSVGNIPSGNYDWTCNLNSSYESLDGESFVSGSITIQHGQNTTISVPMQRIIPLTLNITLYKGSSSNPVPSINTRCSNQKGSVFSKFCTFDTKSYGCCEFIGVDINTDYNTELSVGGMNGSVFNVTFPTSDYYNSDAVCSEWTGRCSRFTGNYRCLYNVESDKQLLLNFSVKDCGSGQYIYGARVTYEDGKSCVTRQNGFCGFSEPVVKDFDVHNYTVSKRPYYEDRTFFFPHTPQVYPLLPCLERNASRNDLNPEVAGAQEGDKDYSGIMSAMFDPTFIAVIFSFIIGGVVTYFSGSSSIGLVSIVGLFAMFTWFGFLPMWIGISIIIIGGLLAVNSVTNVFGG